MTGAWATLNLILLLGLLSMAVYGFVLLVKVLNRAIKALDIYIAEKTNNNA